MGGTLVRVGERYELSFERRLQHTPEKDLLRQWFPSEVIGKWNVGAPLQFNFLHGEGDDLPEEDLRDEVTAVEPLEHLEFRWGM